jgi:hypothetical protein
MRAAVESTAGTARRRRRVHVPRRVRVWGPVLLAVAADFLLQSALNGGPPTERGARLVARIVGFLVAACLAVGYGWYLGARSWRRRGRQLANVLLRRAMRAKRKPVVLLTDRPDFRFSMTRRLFELVAFAAGSTVIVVASLSAIGLPTGLVDALTFVTVVAALWASFILVPYWVFGHMGLRQVDRERWLVQPMSRHYAQRLRLSNGALLLVAFGTTFNLAFRSRASTEAAVLNGVLDIAHVVATVLVAATTALAVYVRAEPELILEVEDEAIRDGIRDGRDMTDEQFLPRLPRA